MVYGLNHLPDSTRTSADELKPNFITCNKNKSINKMSALSRCTGRNWYLAFFTVSLDRETTTQA
jgi:hypothetical protein